MKPEYLFDASSIIKAMKEARLVPLGGQAVQWLTIYEVLNEFWKKTRLIRRLSQDEAASLTEDFTSLLKEMTILDPRGLERRTPEIALEKTSQSTMHHTLHWHGIMG